MSDELLREVRRTGDIVAEALGALIAAVEAEDLPSEEGIESGRRILIAWHTVRALSIEAERS